MRVTVAYVLVHLQKYTIKMCLTAFTYPPLDLTPNLNTGTQFPLKD